MRCVCRLFLALCLSPVALADDPEFTILIDVGAPVPGFPDATFDVFTSGFVDENGTAYFVGRFEGEGITEFVNDRMAYRARGGVAEVVLADGEIPPGMEGPLVASGVGTVALNERGAMVWGVNLGLPGLEPEVGSQAYFIQDGQTLTPLLTGEQTLAVDGVDLTVEVVFGTRGAFNNFGELLSPVLVSGDGVTEENEWLLTLRTTDSIDVIARGGDPIPGDGGYSIQDAVNLAFDAPLNDAGQTIFFTGLSDEDPLLAGFVRASRDGLELLATTEDEMTNAPGVTARFFFQTCRNITEAGTFFTGAILTGDVESDTNTAQLVYEEGLGLRIALREGDVLPGGGVVGNVATAQARVLENGDLFAWVEVDGVLSLVRSTSEATSMLVQRGQTVPWSIGTADLDNVWRTWVNSNGWVMILGSGRGRDGLWSIDPSGEIRLVAREGISYEDANGEEFPIARFSVASDCSPFGITTSRDNRRGCPFNNREEFYFSTGTIAVVVDLTPCGAETNGDGIINILDLLTFVDAFLDGALGADFDGNYVVDIVDLLGFLDDWLTQCAD